jgi:protein-S-isoprenylcysteine O-methyltransferase Ste14
VGIGLYLVRERLLRVRYGVRWPLVVLAVVLFAAAVWVKLVRFRQLGPAVRFGWPELSGGAGAGKLVTGGIYAHIRHPCYVEGGLALASLALFSNALAIYVLLATYFPLIYLVVLLEERELRDRFGEAYERYCRAVPRFVPRLRRPTRARSRADTPP